jgi:hypothetical protein
MSKGSKRGRRHPYCTRAELERAKRILRRKRVGKPVVPAEAPRQPTEAAGEGTTRKGATGR